MNKVPLFVVGCVFFSCNSKECKEEDTPISDPNPNGSSELALLMRSVFEEASDVKSSIASGDIEMGDGFRKKLERFHIAIPTEKRMKPQSFTGFTMSMIDAVKKLEHSTNETAKDDFNNMVDKCLACHAEICPGPMVKIEKLTFK